MLVEPFKSVGGLLFNEKRQSIREKVNETFEARVNEFGGKKEYFDFFPESDFIVFYDENDRAQAFNFFEQNPIFNGINLLTEPYTKLVGFFSELDTDVLVDETSFTSNKYGIGAYCPYKGKNGMSPPESVIIFNHGFYK
jgi:hypothetical protein